MATWWNLEITGVATDADLEHIAGLIREGFTSGQLTEEPETPATGEPEEVFRFNHHSNNLGDYCQYSGERVPADHDEDDESCPQGCRASVIVDATDVNS